MGLGLLTQGWSKMVVQERKKGGKIGEKASI
jgi:hypothetical protein